jgi:hypothetical protein
MMAGESKIGTSGKDPAHDMPMEQPDCDADLASVMKQGGAKEGQMPKQGGTTDTQRYLRAISGVKGG